ncbi:MAG: hypothetical protein J7K26_03095 [Candidatus Aenigmarchaeota archaeon]|nr:hypothetical protein [Candidatus Aenigmarchaeota archaeon]
MKYSTSVSTCMTINENDKRIILNDFDVNVNGYENQKLLSQMKTKYNKYNKYNNISEELIKNHSPHSHAEWRITLWYQMLYDMWYRLNRWRDYI